MIKGRFPRGINKNSLKIVADYNHDRCYKTSFRINRRGKKKLLIIGRAPKRCDELYINKITQRIVKYLNSKKDSLESICDVILVNLFVPFEYNRETINNVLNEKGESFVNGNDEKFIEDDISIKNDSIIKSEIMLSDYIILAWGEPLKDVESIYKNRVEFILKTIRECNVEKDLNKSVYIVGDLTKKGYPRHCMNWTIKDEVNNYFK